MKNKKPTYDELAEELSRTKNELDIIKAKESVEENEVFISKLIETQFDTFFLFNPVTKKPLRWNKQFSIVSEYSDKEIANMKAPDDFYDEEDLAIAAAKTAEILQEGYGVVELELLTKSKKKIPFEYTATLININKDSLFLSVGRDISRRKKYEQDLIAAKEKTEESEDKYRSMFISMQEGVYLHELVYDDHGKAINYRITDANPISEKYLNIKPKDAIGKLATELFATETAPFIDIYAKVAETGEPYKFEQYFEPMDKHFYISVYSPKKGEFATAFLDITKSKKNEIDLIEAKEKAEESEKRMNLVIKGSNDAPWDWDLISNELFYSSQWWQQIGYEPNELPADAALWERLMHPDDKTNVDDVFGSALKNGQKTYAVEFRLLHKQGHYVPVLSRGYISFDENKQPIRVSGTNLDLSERKKTENALLKAREKEEENQYYLKKAQEIGNIGTWELDLRKNKLIWTDENYKIFGVPPGTELTYEIFLNCIHPDDRAYVDEKWAEALKNIPYDIEHRLIVDNKIKWVREKAEIEFDKSNNPVKGLGFTQDITNKKHIEAELIKAKEKAEESEKELRLLAESMPQIVWITKADGWNIYFNQQWCDYTGLTLEESYGHGWNKPFHPDDQQLAWNAWQNAISNNDTYSIECQIRRKDGVYRWWLVRGVPVIDSNGAILKWFGTCTDIHDIKQSEQQLIKAKEKAEESDRLKSAFLANMSHEIRTPMNAIIGFTSLLKKENISKEKKEKYLELIDTGGKRLLSLISDIVDISKIDANQLSLNYESCKLNVLIDNLQHQFKINPVNKGCEIRIKKGLKDEESIVSTDVNRLSQILSNLLENALKFTDNGKIEFGYTREDKMLQFFVKDDGIGIVPKDHKTIFDRFIQVENNYHLTNAGTGLGLSIVKSLTNLLKGEVWVESAKGKGATFYFTIPYNPIEYEGSNSEDVKLISNEEVSILVAEDEYSNYVYLEALLEDNGFNIIHARNGKEAIDILQNNHSIDLVLMDLKMPVMNGYKATEEIRKTNKRIPIIALTAYAMEKDQQRVLQSGFNEYLTKPIEENLLFEIINKYFERNRAGSNKN